MLVLLIFLQLNSSLACLSLLAQHNAERIKNDEASLYEIGVGELILRTEPVGLDRHHGQVYFLRSGTSGILIIQNKSRSRKCGVNNDAISDRIGNVLSRYQREITGQTYPEAIVWHKVDKTSLFDSYVSSLDTRGVRERALHDALTAMNVRHYLRDDLNEFKQATAAQQKVEDIEKLLRKARDIAEGEQALGRRSGRLQHSVHSEVNKLEKDLHRALKVAEEKSLLATVVSARELSGLDLICNLDNLLQKLFLKEVSDTKGYTQKPGITPRHYPGVDSRQHLASSLWRDGGVFEVFTSELMEIETWCNSLCSNNSDLSEQLRALALDWKNECEMEIGPRSHEHHKSDDGRVASAVTTCKQNGLSACGRSHEACEAQTHIQRFIDALKVRLRYYLI